MKNLSPLEADIFARVFVRCFDALSAGEAADRAWDAVVGIREWDAGREKVKDAELRRLKNIDRTHVTTVETIDHDLASRDLIEVDEFGGLRLTESGRERLRR